MKNATQQKTIGTLLIAGALGVLIPYTMLTMTFHYPQVLREDAAVILRSFYEGGNSLIFTWLAFALLGLPLMVAYSQMGQMLEGKMPKWVTTFGIISGIVQIVGLLRWVFVVPVLATEFVHTTDPAKMEAIKIAFKVVHQFGGVLLGEHLGQLFTIIWTVFVSVALSKNGMTPRWLMWLGVVASFIYFFAQTELLATVMPGFPVVKMAGFLGSTLWLVWLMILGVRFIVKPSQLS